VTAVLEYKTSPYAAIGNGRVHYSTTSALPPPLLSPAQHPRDVATYTPDALPSFYDRRDLLSSSNYDRRCSVAPDSSALVELPRCRLRLVHTLGRGRFGDVRI